MQRVSKPLLRLLWSKQYFYFDADQWLAEHHSHPLHPGDRQASRNREWFHMINDDIISAPLPTGGHLEQADGTAWMALFSQNMAELAIELAVHDPVYDELAAKFGEHFLRIAAAMNRPGADGMWDEEDGFYYDILRLPDGTATRLKVRSMVGLLPLCATTIIEPWQREP